jgi:hypothetical protein
MKTKQAPEGTVLELSMTDEQIGRVNRIKKVRINGELDALIRRPLASEIVGGDEALRALVRTGHIRVVQSRDDAGHVLYVESDTIKAAALLKANKV